MALETGCVAHQGEQKSAGKIRLGGESIMWEIAGNGERLDVVFLVRPCPAVVWGRSLAYVVRNHHGMGFRF